MFAVNLLFSLCLCSTLGLEVRGERALQHHYSPHHQPHQPGRADRRLTNVFTNHQHTFNPRNLPSGGVRKNVKRRHNLRGTRKIDIAPLQLNKHFLRDKSVSKDTVKNKYKAELETKHELARAGDDDNIAVESKIIETRVKPDERTVPQEKSQPGSKPKFIIKQAGPSQQFGWVGHGRFAPLNIPNIFKTIGLNTGWAPGVNSVFPVGLTYPAPPPSHSAPVNQVKVQQTTKNYHPATTTITSTTTTTRSTTVKPVTYPTIKTEEIPVYQPSRGTVRPAYRPAAPAQYNEIDTLYYPPSAKSTKKTTTLATTTITTTTSTPARYTYKITTPTSTPYKPVTTTPTLQYTYKTYKTTARPAPVVRYPTTPSQTYFSASTPNPPPYSSPSFYGPHSPVYSSPAPFYGSPSPVYSTPAPFYGSPSTPYYGYGSAQPQPSSVRPFTAFTAFSRTTPAPAPPSAPIIGIIETEDQKTSEQSNDGEVFYIFYENEDLPKTTVSSGLNLQRYIHEEIANEVAEDSQPSESIRHNKKVEPQGFPNFALIEEINKPEPVVFYDVPIKIEETGEGFSPPSEIRTIYVPIENAINVPENFNIDIGTSFGGNVAVSQSVQDKREVRRVRKQRVPVDQSYYGSSQEVREESDLLV